MDDKDRAREEEHEQSQETFPTPPVQPYRPPQMGTFRSPLGEPLPPVNPPGQDRAGGSDEPPPQPSQPNPGFDSPQRSPKFPPQNFGTPPASFSPPNQGPEPARRDFEAPLGGFEPPHQSFEPSPDFDSSQDPGPQFGYPPPPEPPRRPRRRSILGPLFLILLGVFFLLHNLGLIDWSIWEILWRFWPVWLIAAGLDMILGRRGRWGSLLAIALVATVIGGTFFAAGRLQTPSGIALGNEQTIVQTLDGAREARVTINSSVTRLQIAGADIPDRVIQGTVQPIQGEELKQDFRADGTIAYYTLTSLLRNGRIVLGRSPQQGYWDLELNQAIPIALTLQTGVGRSDIDLSNLQVTDLRVSTGVGETILSLPRKGALRASIESGVGQTIVRVPNGLAVRIRVQTGIGGVSSSGNLVRDGNTFTTPNWDSAADRAEVEIEGGVGGVRIEAAH